MARQFTAANSEYLENTSAVVTAVPLTMACWFKSDSASAVQTLLSISDQSAIGSEDYFRLVLVGSAGGDPLYFQTGGAASAITSSGYTTGTWHHACGVSSAIDNRAVYIDGGSGGTNTGSRTPTGLDVTNIGRVYASFGAEYMDGAIAEAAIWNVVLNQSEIESLAEGVAASFIRPASLVFYAPMIRGVSASGGNDQDIVGGLTLTDNATVTVADHPPVYYPSRLQLGVPASGTDEQEWDLVQAFNPVVGMEVVAY